MTGFDLPPIWVPPSPAVIRPAGHALLKPGAFRPASRAEGRAILADLVRSGRMSRAEARAATIFIPWIGGAAAPAEISAPASLGSSVGTAGDGTATMTTGAAIPAGALAVVAIVCFKSSTISVSSVSDGTNSYTRARTTTWSASTYVTVELWYKENAAPVSAGATITATLSAPSSNGPPLIAAASVGGILGASPLDKVNSAVFSSATSFASGTTGTLSQAKEIAIGAIGGYTTPGGTPTIGEGAGFTIVGSTVIGSTRYFLHLGQQIVDATTALNYQPGASITSLGGILISTFKGAAA